MIFFKIKYQIKFSGGGGRLQRDNDKVKNLSNTNLGVHTSFPLHEIYLNPL